MAQSRRLDLHDLLKALTPNVYFQPTENVKMTYPCIVYKRDYANTNFADNQPYRHTKRYQITYISRDPDSDEILDKIASMRMCTFQTSFVADNLNHDVYNLFF